MNKPLFINCSLLGREIPLVNCQPDAHPKCLNCDTPKRKILKKNRSSNPDPFKPHNRDIHHWIESIINEGRPPFDNIEYHLLLVDTVNSNEEIVNALLWEKINGSYKFNDKTQNDVIFLIYQKAIEVDIEFLRWVFNEFKKEIKKRKPDKDKYKEFAKWIIDVWGNASKFVLGDTWEKFKSTRGRKNQPGTINKAVDFYNYKKLKDIGFEDSAKAGTFYGLHKPKNLIRQALYAFSILHYNDFVLELLAEKNSKESYFNTFRNLQKMKEIIPLSKQQEDLLMEIEAVLSGSEKNN